MAATTNPLVKYTNTKKQNLKTWQRNREWKKDPRHSLTQTSIVILQIKANPQTFKIILAPQLHLMVTDSIYNMVCNSHVIQDLKRHVTLSRHYQFRVLKCEMRKTRSNICNYLDYWAKALLKEAPRK